MISGRISIGKLIALLLLSQTFLLIGLLGVPQIGGSSEAREAQVIDIMFRSGELVLPLRNGLIPSKPPFYHWCGYGIASILGGVNEFVVRLPSVFFCIGTLICLGGVVRSLSRLDRLQRQDGNEVVLYSIAATSLMYGFIHMGQRAMVDMCFTFWCWLAWYFGVRALVDKYLHNDDSVRKWQILFWLSCGVAALARGPIGVLLPPSLLFLGSWSVIGFRKALILWGRPSLGWVGALCLVLPWYFLAFERGGDAFIERQLLFENLKRFQGGEFVNAEPFWYYIPSLVRTAFPWSLFLLALLIDRYKRGSLASFLGSDLSPLRTILIMALGGVLIFSFASGKRHSYMLPLFPMFGAATAFAVRDWMYTLSDRGVARLLSSLSAIRVTTLAILAICMFAVAYFSKPGAVSSSFAWELNRWIANQSVPITAFCALSVAILIAGRTSGTLYTRLFFAWFGVSAVMCTALCIGTGLKGRIKNFQPIADAILQHLPNDAELAVIKHERDEFFDPILYYVHRPVTLLARDLPIQDCRRFTVTLATWYDDAGSKKLREAGFELREIERFNDLSDAAKGIREREMILFSCEKGTETFQQSGFT